MTRNERKVGLLYDRFTTVITRGQVLKKMEHDRNFHWNSSDCGSRCTSITAIENLQSPERIFIDRSDGQLVTLIIPNMSDLPTDGLDIAAKRLTAVLKTLHVAQPSY